MTVSISQYPKNLTVFFFTGFFIRRDNYEKKQHSLKNVMEVNKRFNILIGLPRQDILDKKGNVDQYYVHDIASIIYWNIHCPHCQMIQFHKVMSALEHLGYEKSCLRDFHQGKPFDAKYFVSVLTNYIEANNKIDEILTFDKNRS